MKSQALFSLKDKSKKLKCRLLQFLFGALRVKLKVRMYKRVQVKKGLLDFFTVCKCTMTDCFIVYHANTIMEVIMCPLRLGK